MGHRNTSEEASVARGVCCADRGFAADDRERTAAREDAIVARGASVKSAGVRVALLALRFYKAYLSLLFAGACRFEPTCSRYAYAAIERFGVARGSWLALKRLGRCQPFSGKFGFDPVPDASDSAPRMATARSSQAGSAAVSHHEVLS